MARVSAMGLPKLFPKDTPRVSARLGCCYLECSERIHFQAPSGCFINSVPVVVGLRSPAPCWLSARDHFLLPEATQMLSHTAPPLPKPPEAPGVPLILQLSLTFPSATSWENTSAFKGLVWSDETYLTPILCFTNRRQHNQGSDVWSYNRLLPTLSGEGIAQGKGSLRILPTTARHIYTPVLAMSVIPSTPAF